MTSDVLVWHKVAWVASVAGVLLIVFLLLYLCVKLTVYLTVLEKDRANTLLFVSFYILLTFFIIALSVHWCSPLKTEFSSSVAYLLFVASCVLLPLFTLLNRHDGGAITLHWPICIIVHIFAIIVSLNVLLLDTYEYCQRYEDIDVSLEAFVQKVAQQFVTLAIFLPVTLFGGMLLCALSVDERICRLLHLNFASWSLRYSTLLFWLVSCFAVPACYEILSSLESNALITRFESLLRSDLRLSIPCSIVSIFCCAFMSFGCNPTRCMPWFYVWMNFIKWSVLCITLAATILVHVPATPHATPTSHLETTPTHPVKSCMEVNRDGLYEVQLKHLLYLEYLHDDKSQELKIMEEILGYCDELADKFGFKTVSHSCSKSDAESCCRSVFKEWQVRDSPGYTRSWNGLLKALRELGLKRLVKDIETALDCVISA